MSSNCLYNPPISQAIRKTDHLAICRERTKSKGTDVEAFESVKQAFRRQYQRMFGPL